jgi:hypothetical protein
MRTRRPVRNPKQVTMEFGAITAVKSLFDHSRNAARVILQATGTRPEDIIPLVYTIGGKVREAAKRYGKHKPKGYRS